ncbi:MAG: response regulator [Deltaproteobacteria bacterium]|nr:MAG: response regulator [Deltaproteobacteria bacterium]
MRIWVIDDDQAICNLLRIMLSARGHEVATFSDPTATPVLCDDGTPCAADVMLIDYFMPNMNGLEFLKVLDARGCRGARAIITAHYSPELGRELAGMGVACFRKPFRWGDVVGWLDDCAQKTATVSP